MGTTRYIGQAPTVRPGALAFQRAGIDQDRAMWDRGYAVGFFDHFSAFHPIAASGVSGPWYGYIDTGNTIKPVVTAPHVVELAVDATDNDGPVLAYGTEAASATGVPFKLTSGGNAMAGGARIKIASAALAENAFFVGLAEEARAVDNGLMADDTGAMVTGIDYIGFNCPAHASVAKPDCVYLKSGGTAKEVAADVLTGVLDTWYALEWSYNPTDDTFRFYVDGVEVGSFDMSAAGTTNFPSGEEMTFYIALKTGEGAVKKLDVDWAYCFQLL